MVSERLKRGRMPWERAKRPLTVLALMAAAAGGLASEAIKGSLTHRDTITSARIKHLGESTVLLLDRPRGSSKGWHPDCSGTKVALGSKSSYVLTAAHCLDFNIKAKPDGKAVNVLPYDKHDYIVANNPAKLPNKKPRAALLGKVAAISYIPGKSQNGLDLALLKITNKKRASANKFNSMPAIPFDQIGGRVRQHEPVVVESYPVSVNYSQTSTPGEYLGRISAPPFLGREESIDVGMHVTDATHDACEHGGSGAGLVTSSTFLGPLSYRSETGMESHRPIQHDTEHDIAVGIAMQRESRSQLQAALHVDLSPFNVACVLTVLPKNSAENLLGAF